MAVNGLGPADEFVRMERPAHGISAMVNESGAQCLIIQQSCYASRKGDRIAGRVEKSIHSVLDDFGRAARRRADYGHANRHRFQYRL